MVLRGVAVVSGGCVVCWVGGGALVGVVGAGKE